jgi:hypothetical protein
MSDLETRLAEALRQGAEGAPAAVGLADAARSRARTKRRARMGGVVAAVTLCIAVPTAVVAVRGSDDTGPGPSHGANDDAASRGIPAGQRVESWHGVTALVPDSWGWGSLEDWCADGGQLEPRVERPGGVSLDIKCATSTYGLSFQQLPPGQDRDQVFDWPVTLQTSKGWPPDAYVGAHGIGDVLVEVTATTPEAALAVLATVREIGSTGDPNGCPSSSLALVRPVGDGMSVCRYDESGLLEQSELLDADDAGTAEQAIRTASLDARRGPPCIRPHAPTTTIRMVSSDFDATVTFGGSCWIDTRVRTGDDARLLDPEVLYWALSPGWSGSVPADVSLPSELRQR